MEGKEEGVDVMGRRGISDYYKSITTLTHSSHHPLLPITTPLTVYTGMMSSVKYKYLVAMLIGLSAIN